MAESLLTAQDSFSCPICLDLLKDPVAVPCGHSYCLDCIKDYWDQEDQTGVYSCPQCAQTFTARPVLNKNTLLAELTERLRKMRLQAASPADSYAGPGDVVCEVCTGTKHKAVKSCLVCMASYCKTHIQAHYESAALKKHKLVEASMNLQEKICSHHDKLVEIYCRTDQQFICQLCVMDEHNGHKTVSTAAERNEKEKQLLKTQWESLQKIQLREKELQDVRQTVVTLRSSAQATVEDSEKIFTELIVSIEKKRSEVKEQIRAQEEAELSLAKDLQKKLEQEIADLRRRHTELEQLSHTEDHIHFLQSFQSLSVPPKAADLVVPRTMAKPPVFMKLLRKALSQIKEQVEKLDKLLPVEVSEVFFALELEDEITLLPHPETREDHLRYSRKLTLDPNTANGYFYLSEGNRKVTHQYWFSSYPDHPERFDHALQVLCSESLSGRCYWEVKGFPTNSAIAVCYKDISRKGKGNECKFGYNDQSWSLIQNNAAVFFLKHNAKDIAIPIPEKTMRIGVYVDHSAGILSFYSISKRMTLLYTVETTFTKPLYAGFQVDKEGFIQICEL